jgi:hypothetical protein
MFTKKMKSLAARAKKSHLALCQKLGAARFAPTEKQAQGALFVLGLTVLVFGLSDGISAQAGISGTTKYNDQRIANAVNAVMTYLEGTFGALVMAAAGIGAILSAAFGQYKAALSLMVVAIGAFILRSLMSTFFNDLSIQQ